MVRDIPMDILILCPRAPRPSAISLGVGAKGSGRDSDWNDSKNMRK